jgi:hypothetical protein
LSDADSCLFRILGIERPEKFAKNSAESAMSTLVIHNAGLSPASKAADGI